MFWGGWEFSPLCFTSPASPTTTGRRSGVEGCRVAGVWSGVPQKEVGSGAGHWAGYWHELWDHIHRQWVTCVCLLSVETHCSLLSLCSLLSYLSFVFISLSPTHFSSPNPSSFFPPSYKLQLQPLFSLLPPSLTLLACGGLWVNSRFFISLLWLGGKRACKPLWEMSVSVCWESRGPFTSHQTRCHIETAKWRLTGHSIEPNHLYQMWQQGKEDVW